MLDVYLLHHIWPRPVCQAQPGVSESCHLRDLWCFSAQALEAWFTSIKKEKNKEAELSINYQT